MSELSDFKIEGTRNWVKYDTSWKDEVDSNYVHKFKCSIKPMICLRKFPGGIASCIVELDDTFKIESFLVFENKDRKLEAVYLGEQKHPQKDPRNGYMCIGKNRGLPVNIECLKNIYMNLLQYREYDCYIIPEMKEKSHWRLLKECQIS